MDKEDKGQYKSIPAELEQFITKSVISKDGTTVSYLQIGRGPGVVILHGTMESARSHMRLATSLADTFTVYLPDRRSLNLGFPFSKNYNIQKEIEDLEALLLKTDTHNIFGVSSGGIICLQTALIVPGIRKAAIYEPPLSFTRSYATSVLSRFDKEMEQGKIGAALITAMKGSRMGPPVFNSIPNWLLERLTARMMKQNSGKATSGDPTMQMLAPALHYDFQLVAEMSETLDKFKAIRSEVLLLGGSKSQSYLKRALDSLRKVIPYAKRVEFLGLDHGGSSDPGNFNKHGNPEEVAQELRRFYL